MDHQGTELEGLRAGRDAEVAVEATTPAAAGGMALCLSGGGYRAAIFHLGALLRLHQLGRLGGLRLISAVSGGSILAAFLMARYLDQRIGQESFADWCSRIDFHATVVAAFATATARDIRTGPWLKTALFNWLAPASRVKLLEAAYTRLLGAHTLDQLPVSPRVVFCATNLTFGVNWEFSKERVGDYLSGYLDDGGSVTLARAVAASSSFPPVFGPMVLKNKAAQLSGGRYRGHDAQRLRSRIELSDGGVYDNLATEPSLKRYEQVLISDAGAPFPFTAGQHSLRRLLRYTEVIGNQAAALRRRLFFILRGNKTFSGSYWNLGGSADPGADGYSEALIRQSIAGIRTDLDRFSPAEFQILVNHGYFSCQDGLARAGLLQPDAAAAMWPYPELADEQRVRAALRHSHRRLWPPRWLARTP